MIPRRTGFANRQGNMEVRAPKAHFLSPRQTRGRLGLAKLIRVVEVDQTTLDGSVAH